MNIESIQSFISIVQQQTISAAAKSLFVSQSTISHRIQVLEQELGVTLFDRQRGFKKMELTEEGRKFYPLAMQWLQLDSRMHEIRCDTSLGKVRIGSMDSINQYLLPPMISHICEKTPELQLEFVSYHSQEIYTRITSQLIDLGFAFYPIRYDIIATPVFSEPMYMVAPPESQYAEGPIHPSQLSKSDQIFFAWNDEAARWNNEWWDEHDAPYVKVDSCALLTTFLTDPRRWAVCPASVATSLRAAYATEIHPFKVAPPNRITYMLTRKYPRGEGQPAAIVRFIQAFNEEAEKSPWHYRKR